MKRIRVATSCLAGAGADLEKATELVGGKLDAAVAREVFILGALIKSQGYGYMKTGDGRLVLTTPVEVARVPGQLPSRQMADAVISQQHPSIKLPLSEAVIESPKPKAEPGTGSTGPSPASKPPSQVVPDKDPGYQPEVLATSALPASQDASQSDDGSQAPHRPRLSEAEANKLLDQLF